MRRDNRAGQADWTNLYVKGLPESWDDAKLREEFEKHGPVTRWALSEFHWSLTITRFVFLTEPMWR